MAALNVAFQINYMRVAKFLIRQDVFTLPKRREFPRVAWWLHFKFLQRNKIPGIRVVGMCPDYNING